MPLRIGAVRAGYQSPVLDKVLAMEQRPYTLAEYSTPMALEDAYRAGKIDGFEVNTWPVGPEEPAAAYDVTTTHLAVKKGNTELLNRLNAAADRLMLARPTVLADIYRMHEGEVAEVPLLLDRTERDYLALHPTLRVLVVANERPYAYLDDDGQLAGAMRVITERVAADLGVTLDIVTMTDYEKAYAAMQDGEADVTYIRVEAAQYETMRGAYPDLVPSGRIAFARGIAMGVPTSGDPVLLRVLDKEIHHMGQSVTEAYYAEEAQKSFRERTALSVIYTYPQRALAILAALHAMGFAIDMDDFGSGYSDLSLLNQLPLDVMKIDRSLLLASEGSERMCVVLRQMVGLGHALGMKVICEGIETTTQEELLIGCGCEYGQGYLYGKPMKRADFEAFLKEHV